MTVENVANNVSYIGDGVTQGPYAVNFRCDSPDWLFVFVDGGQVTNYTYTPYLDQSDTPGGNVVFDAPVADGLNILIQRQVPRVQETNYTPYDQFPAERLETDLDTVTMMLQDADQQSGDLGGAIARAYVVQGSVQAGSKNIISSTPFGDFAIVTTSITPSNPAGAYALTTAKVSIVGQAIPLGCACIPAVDISPSFDDNQFAVSIYNLENTQVNANLQDFVVSIYDGA